MFRPEILLKIDDIPDLQDGLQKATHSKFHGLITQVVNDKFKKEMLDEEIKSNQQNFTRSPLILTANQWLNQVYPLIKICDDLNSSNDVIRENYEQRLIQEINFAYHLKACGIIYIQPSGCDPEVLGKFLTERLPPNTDVIKFVVEVHLISTRSFSSIYRNDLTEEQREDFEQEDLWSYWNKLHKAANYSQLIDVALVLSSDVPKNECVYRWLSEPIACIVIPYTCFIMNNANYPVLSKKQQEVVKLFMQYAKCTIVIEPKSIDAFNNVSSIMDYVQHLATFVVYNEHYTEQDSLRFPLQPLFDNLDTSTYETFERDPMKYSLYQKAIESALLDMVPDEEKETKTIILMIVGAGRGPLIRSALNASVNTNRKMKILAVEKNPNAIVTLSCLIRDLWPEKDIELIAKDMRKIELEEKVDILVSELLGSFGDNELSPECLDGTRHLLKETGISIPSNSKSYIQPIMTKRNYGKIQKRPNMIGTSNSLREKYSEQTEINWLIYFANVYHIDDTKELFTFVYPNNEEPIDNTRYEKLDFRASLDCVLHGFAGYFTSQLYKDIEISILPSTHTKGMASWYSIFFPISSAIQVKSGDKITAEFWRKGDLAKVWYEWKTTVEPEESIVHNLSGDIHPILL